MPIQIGDIRRRSKFLGLFGVALAVVVAAILLSPPAQAKMTLKDTVSDKEIKLQIYGFSQFEIRGGKGWQMSKSLVSDGPDFSAQRIRVGFNYYHYENVAGKLFLDFNQSHTSDEGGLPKMIKDAFVAYRWNNSAFVRLGMIKTPLGMSFTVPGWNLDNIERNGLDKGLVLERDFGLMLSGRLIGQERFNDKKQMKTDGLEMGTERQGYGFGYDIGVFNPAGRSSAVTWSATASSTVAGGTVRGDALAYVGRVHFDYGQPLHVEAAYGVSEQAAGNIDNPLTVGVVEKSEDYEVFDVGFASELWDAGWEFKVEYINGSNIRGVKDWDQDTVVGTVGYMVAPMIELMAKSYQATSTKSNVETKLGNTYIGFNWYPKRVNDKHRDLQRNKIVVNYVFVNGDDVDSSTPWNGIGGYKDDTYGVQWQYKF